MSRKSYHGKTGVRFKAPYTTSKNKSMLRNVVTDLIVHGRVEVTLATAKELVVLADEMVTLAKRGDLHARRQAAAVVRDVYANNEKNQTALRPTARYRSRSTTATARWNC